MNSLSFVSQKKKKATGRMKFSWILSNKIGSTFCKLFEFYIDSIWVLILTPCYLGNIINKNENQVEVNAFSVDSSVELTLWVDYLYSYDNYLHYWNTGPFRKGRNSNAFLFLVCLLIQAANMIICVINKCFPNIKKLSLS